MEGAQDPPGQREPRHRVVGDGEHEQVDVRRQWRGPRVARASPGHDVADADPVGEDAAPSATPVTSPLSITRNSKRWPPMSPDRGASARTRARVVHATSIAR